MERTISVIKTLLLSWLSIIFVGCCAGSIGVWVVDYDFFAHFVLDLLNRQDWRGYFEEKVFPPARYELARYALPFVTILWIPIAYFIWKRADNYSRSIASFIVETKNKIATQLHGFQIPEKKYFAVLILLFALRGLFQLYRYELQYDEAWTYNHFISKGFIISAISPNNNHILYTLLACLTDYLPLEAKYSLRLPVYLGGIATCSLIYAMLRYFWGWKWAIVALAWFAFSPSICFYSMYARGYIFQIFFTILAVWASLQIVQKGTQTQYYWGVWILANVLAAYSVPTHAYSWVILNAFLFIALLEQKISLKPWFKANIAVLLAIFILYFPFFITNGMTTLFAAASTEAPQGEAFVTYQDKVADWLLVGGGRGTAVYWFQILLLLILAFLCFLNRKDILKKNTILLSILFLALPSLLNLLVGTQPPYRIWCFLAIFLSMTIAIIGSATSIQKDMVLIPLAIFFISWNCWRAEIHYAIRWSAKLDQDAKEIAQILLNKNIQECYFFSHYDKPLLEFYYLRAGKYLKTKMFDPNSQNYAPFVDARVYECVLWDKEDRVGTQAEMDWLRGNYKEVVYENERIFLIGN